MSAVDLSVGPPAPPEVEPGALGDSPTEVVGDELGPAPVITEQQVRDLLDGLGRAASVPPANLGVPQLWRFTVDELDGLAPPLTRIINRRPALARMVERGDEVMVALQLSAYLGQRTDRVVAARREENTDGDREREAGPAAAQAHAADRWVDRAGADVGGDGDRATAPHG